MKTALKIAGTILGSIVLIAGLILADLARRMSATLERHERQLEGEIQEQRERSSRLAPFDWPPYREALHQIELDRPEDEPRIARWQDESKIRSDGFREILRGRQTGSLVHESEPALGGGSLFRGWRDPPRAPPPSAVRDLLLSTILAQDGLKGAGLELAFCRMAWETRLTLTWRELLSKRPPEAEELKTIADVLGRLESTRAPLGPEIQMEHVLRCRAVVEIFRTGKDPLSFLRAQVGWRSLFSRRLLFAQVFSELDRNLEEMIQIESLPIQERCRRSESVFNRPDRESIRVPTLPYNSLSLFREESAGVCQRTMLRVALALARHGAERGALPETLADLVPVYLTSVPACPLTGKPLTYHDGVLRGAGDGPLSIWQIRRPPPGSSRVPGPGVEDAND